MKIVNYFRNRTVLGVTCIAIAFVICFVISPLMSNTGEKMITVVRVVSDIKSGDEVTKEMVTEIVDFVIVDCSSHLSDDILSTIALIESDSVLRLINCDLKSISYLSSQLPLLADSKFKAEKQIKIANNVKAMHSGENIAQILGGVAFTIPHSDLVEQQYLNGELLKPTPIKRETKEFRNRIEEIAEEVFGL